MTPETPAARHAYTRAARNIAEILAGPPGQSDETYAAAYAKTIAENRPPVNLTIRPDYLTAHDDALTQAETEPNAIWAALYRLIAAECWNLAAFSPDPGPGARANWQKCLDNLRATETAIIAKYATA